MKLSFGLILVLLTAALFSGCTFGPDVAETSDFNGMTSISGGEMAHYNQGKLALNLLLFSPLVGDASLGTNMDEVTSRARQDGFSEVRTAQSSESMYWWVFFPFSLIITPIYSNVAIDATK